MKGEVIKIVGDTSTYIGEVVAETDTELTLSNINIIDISHARYADNVNVDISPNNAYGLAKEVRFAKAHIISRYTFDTINI